MLKHFIILCTITLTIAKAANIQHNVQSLYSDIDKGLDMLCLKANISLEVSKDVVTDYDANIITSVDEEIVKIKRQVSTFFQEMKHIFCALEVRPTNPNMIECGQVREVHRINIAELTEDTVNCMKQKRTDAAGLIRKMDDIWRETVVNITGLKVKASECVRNPDGFKNATRAIYCLEKVRRIGNSMYSVKMAELEEVRNAVIALADGIEYSLAYCRVTSGFGDLIGSTFISDNMRDCFEQVKDSLNMTVIQRNGQLSQVQSANNNSFTYY